MNEAQLTKTITFKGTSEGIDKLTADLNKLASATENVAVVTEKSSGRIRSIEDAYKRQTLKLDEAARAQNNIARETRLADAALRENVINQQQHAERLELINQRYNTVSQSTQKFAQQTGLARHELINLGRQAQDVSVSLASGQSPFMVLVQQGTQIADVFATSGGTVRGFFTQAIGFAGRFVASAAGMATAVGSIAAALLYAASSADAANKAIDKVLTSGPGAASGLSRGGLNQIAQGAAGSGMGINEARAAALEFAKTGQIYEANIKSATEATRLFAQAAGIDAADASKQLAKALVDPSQGAQELNKQFGFLDATLLNHIRTLQSQGKLQEAQAALLAGLTPTLQKQASTVDFLTAAWRKADQAVIDFNKSIDEALGLAPKGLTTQLDEAVKKLQAAQDAVANAGDLGVGPRGMKALQDAATAAEVEVRRLEKAMADLNAQTEAQRLKDLSNIADAFTRALIPSIEQVEKLTLAITKMKEAQAAGVGGPNTGAAINIAQRQLSIAQETKDIEERKAQVFQQQGGTINQILAGLRDQANVAGAVGVQEEMRAQRQARINQLVREGIAHTDAVKIANAEMKVTQERINAAHEKAMILLGGQLNVAQQVTGAKRIEAQYEANIVQLMLQGFSLAQATAQAEMQRAIALAQVNVQAERRLKSLQDEYEIIRATSEEEKGRIRARQEYFKLIDEGVTTERAGAIASQMQANARATEDAKDTTKSWSVANDEAVEANGRLQQQVDNTTASMKGLEEAMNSTFLHALPLTRMVNELFNPYIMGKTAWEKGGQLSQFNPAGYTSATTETSNRIFSLTSRYGPGGFDPQTGMPNAQGLAYQYRGTSSASAILGGGLTSTRYTTGMSGFPVSEAVLDPGKVSMAQRAIELLPDAQQIGALQQMLEMAKAAPPGLEQAELVKQLMDKIEQLTRATDENTSATQAMTDVLSPFYSSDPRRTHLGFRAFAGGGIMSSIGELPMMSASIHRGGGITNTPQAAMFGEGSVPEAYVPVPSGRIPVEIKAPANNNQRPISVTINVMGNADTATVAALKQTSFQKAQALRRMTG